MNINDLSILTVSFNNNVLTGLMLKSFIKQTEIMPEIVIVDNGNKKPVDENLKSIFIVVDNFNHKLLPDENQVSRNHCIALDYAIKNVIKTKWVLIVDNDILFKSSVKKFLKEFNEEEFDCAGEIGWDKTPPNRLYPYFCLINVEKMKNEQINYFDRSRMIWRWKQCNKFDTGYSFYEDIKKKEWKIKKIKLSDYIVHLKSGTLQNKNISEWLNKHKNLF